MLMSDRGDKRRKKLQIAKAIAANVRAEKAELDRQKLAELIAAKIGNQDSKVTAQITVRCMRRTQVKLFRFGKNFDVVGSQNLIALHKPFVWCVRFFGCGRGKLES